MKLGKFTAVNKIDIWQPKWSTRKVLIAKFRVGTHNLITFTKAPSLAGDYYMSGEAIRTYPLDTNGRIPCYSVDLDDLEPLEREE